MTPLALGLSIPLEALNGGGWAPLEALRSAGPALPALLALVLGGVLWMWGGRLARPLAITLGGAAGALSGWSFLATFLPQSIGEIPGPVAGAGIGLLAGVCLALGIFRLGVALASSAVLASLAAAGCLAASPPPTQDSSLRAASAPLVMPEDVRSSPRVVDDAWARARVRLNSLGRSQRATALGATAAGAVIGLGLGLVAPRRAAGLCSACLGAAMLTAGSMWLLGSALPALLPSETVHSARAWGILWALLALVGTAYQFRSMRAPSAA